MAGGNDAILNSVLDEHFSRSAVNGARAPGARGGGGVHEAVGREPEHVREPENGANGAREQRFISRAFVPGNKLPSYKGERFSGEPGTQAVHSFVMRLHDFYEKNNLTNHCTDAQMVITIKECLDRGAYDFAATTIWASANDLIQALIVAFHNPVELMEVRQQIRNLRPMSSGNGLAQIVSEHRRLAGRARLDEPDLLDTFLCCLDHELSAALVLTPWPSMEAVYVAAAKVESQRKRVKGGKSGGGGVHAITEVSGSVSGSERTCYRCGKVGHIRRDCPDKPVPKN
jgi:hypothetical protein